MPCAAAAHPRVDPAGWRATLVNAEERSVPDGGRLPLCQAIPVTVLAVRLRYEDARPGVRLRLHVRAGGHARTRVRSVRLPRRAGTVHRAFTPQGLHLRAAAFHHGAMTVRAVGPGGRTLARARLTLVSAGVC